MGNKRPHILCVEDHTDTAATLAKLLARRGYSVHVVGSVAAAIEIHRDQKFDLVLADISLPDGDGYELIRHLRGLGPIKAIALTGHGMLEDVRRSHEAGFIEHLTKPVSMEVLEASIERVMEGFPCGCDSECESTR